MRQLTSVAISLVLVAATAAQPKPAESHPKPGPTVEQLVSQLGDREFRVRDQASKAIAALGIDALPALQKSRVNPDPEIRRRLDELIPPLERAITLQSKQISLHMTNKPIKDIIAELNKQTGYKLMTMDGGTSNDKAVYTFNFDKLSFWEAMDKISEATGLLLQHGYWGDDNLRLSMQDSYVPFNHNNGAFKVMATGFSYNRSNNFGQLPRNPANAGQPISESLTISMSIASEPRLPILAVKQLKFTEARDEEGNSMVPGGDGNANWGGQRYYYGGWYRGFLQQTQANLAWPSKSSRMIKSLKGVVPVTILADQKPSVITDKLLKSKGKKFKAGSATFTIDDVTEQAGKQYQIKMSVTEDSKDGPQDYTRIQSLQQRLELQDDKGNKQQFYFSSINWGGPNNAQFTFTVQPGAGKLGPANKLIYYAWVLMEHEIPFEFKDLPLP